jgi:glycosyltransferase involved in cell wall biosynthesis
MKLPTISVIIPTFNNGCELRKAILSIKNQDAWLNNDLSFEIILVNDASEAKFRNQLDKIVEEFSFCKLLHQIKQTGPAAARNKGIENALGNIIGFLDADDEWPLNKISLLMPYFSAEKTELIGGKIKYIVDEGVSDVNMKFEDEENRITHVHLGAILVRKSVFQKGLFFNTTLELSEDVDWWLRLRENQIQIQITDFTTLIYHIHGNNMSINKSISELQLLKIFHLSAKRRSLLNIPYIPQIKDFKINQEEPLISIVLPLYNGKHLIDNTIQGVLNQIYSNWELIVVDDGSIDDGADYISKKYPLIKVIRQQNKGVAAARNIGIKAASGELIAFLDQDDEWMPTKLKKQWDLLKENPYCTFITCNQKFICQEGVVLPANFSQKLFDEHRSLVPSALLVRKQALLHVGCFDESLEVSSDFDLIRKLRKANFSEANVNLLLLKKWYHGNNASQDKTLLRSEILSLLFKQSKGL